MPEMRAETDREAKRKGIAGPIEQPNDFAGDLTAPSRPAKPHTSTREDEPVAEIDPTGSERQPDPATREEHLRSDPRLKGGATGGPS